MSFMKDEDWDALHGTIIFFLTLFSSFGCLGCLIYRRLQCEERDRQTYQRGNIVYPNIPV